MVWIEDSMGLLQLMRRSSMPLEPWSFATFLFNLHDLADCVKHFKVRSTFDVIRFSSPLTNFWLCHLCYWYIYEGPQYSLARSAWLSVHKVFISCIRRGLVSLDSLVHGDWLPATEWCQCYLPGCQPMSDVAGEVSCMGLGNDLKLIPTVEMETRNPVNGYFGSTFSDL